MGEKDMQKYFEKWDASTFSFPTAGTEDLKGLTWLKEGQLRHHLLKDNIRDAMAPVRSAFTDTQEVCSRKGIKSKP